MFLSAIVCQRGGTVGWWILLSNTLRRRDEPNPEPVNNEQIGYGACLWQGKITDSLNDGRFVPSCKQMLSARTLKHQPEQFFNKLIIINYFIQKKKKQTIIVQKCFLIKSDLIFCDYSLFCYFNCLFKSMVQINDIS